jgi:hypothetical protein
MINVFEANRTVENKANKIPEPFTKPACINAEAGVGESHSGKQPTMKG